MKLKTFSAILMSLALTACFHDSDDPPFDLEPSIDVITVSGTTVALDGTLVRPCAKNISGFDYLVTETISRNSGVRTEYSYTSTDGSCSGTETIEAVYKVTFKTGSVMAITGWVNLIGISVTPPQAQDSSGPLLNNESGTSLTIIINSVDPVDPNISPGTEMPSFYVVDDTVAGAPVLYGKSNSTNDAFNVPMTPQ
jgi:hypothetical protein